MKAFFLAAALLAAMPALADPRDDMPAADRAAFDTYLASPAYASRLSDLVAMAKPDNFAGCESLTTDKAGTTVVKPVRMGTDGVPKEGMWKSAVPVSGCGKGRIVNAFFLVGKDDKVHFLMALPGSTVGDITLQRDTVMYVLMAAMTKSRDCKTRNIVNSRFDVVAAPGEQTKSAAAVLHAVPAGPEWRETWTVEACGKYLEVGVRYLKDMTGTTITAASDEVVEVTKEQADKP